MDTRACAQRPSRAEALDSLQETSLSCLSAGSGILGTTALTTPASVVRIPQGTGYLGNRGVCVKRLILGGLSHRSKTSSLTEFAGGIYWGTWGRVSSQASRLALSLAPLCLPSGPAHREGISIFLDPVLRVSGNTGPREAHGTSQIV